jgi:hypothetical protein
MVPSGLYDFFKIAGNEIDIYIPSRFGVKGNGTMSIEEVLDRLRYSILLHAHNHKY